MHKKTTDVLVIGGGPAGLAAAVSAHDSGAQVLLIERESELGGMLKQCIHDGFGLMRFGERLAGPEYAHHYISRVKNENIPYLTETFVLSLERLPDESFIVKAVTQSGIILIEARALVLATGCRERTAKQVFIQGSRPSGVLTAGTAQHMINLQGKIPAKRCVILGSGDIGLIMARRLTLEGAEVLGVYEIQKEPSGLTRNIAQCLDDFNIPLHLSTTVTRIFGRDRLEAVEIMKVDENLRPMPGSEEKILCDALILSVGLIPENELAEKLDVLIDGRTGGPSVDESFMSSQPGVFSCGNAMSIHDLVDFVSTGAEKAGAFAAEYAGALKSGCYKKSELPETAIICGEGIASFLPQRLSGSGGTVSCCFRSSRSTGKSRLVLSSGGKEIFSKTYPQLKAAEMQRPDIRFDSCVPGAEIEVRLEEL